METEKKHAFLDKFQELEKYLRIEYVNGSYKESTFMGTLFRIRGRKENKIIANPHYFDTLQQAAQLRNIIVHNSDVAEPTDRFMKRFFQVVDNILHPIKVVDIMVPIQQIKKLSLEATIGEAIQLMETTGYSKIPVFSGYELQGVFTEKSLYYCLSLDRDAVITKNRLLHDLLKAIDLDGVPAKYFAFIAKNATAFQALGYFRRDFKEKNKLEMLFVTPSGKREESILGILTLSDIERAL
jgi:CBS domain containing-hemolysin-like protein